MPRSRFQPESVDQICIENRPHGLRAVYMVETLNENDSIILAGLFADFESQIESIQLSSGKLVSYAVQIAGEEQSILEEIETFLKKNFGFVILHRSFDQIIYDIVKDLCKDSGSHIAPLHKCDICGKAEPFPETVVTFLDKDNSNLATHIYCTTCTAESAARNNKEFIRSLLEADKSDFAILRRMDIVRNRSMKKHIAFRIKSEEHQQYAIR